MGEKQPRASTLQRSESKANQLQQAVQLVVSPHKGGQLARVQFQQKLHNQKQAQVAAKLEGGGAEKP